MSVGERIQSAIAAIERCAVNDALIQVSIAIDATAARETGVGGRTSYKDFIHRNMDVITKTGFGPGSILSLHVVLDHPGIKPASDGTCALHDVLYHAVRCALLHEATLPQNLRFETESRIWYDNGVLVLPLGLVLGLIIGVITSKANACERVASPCTFNLGECRLPINALWGRKDEVMWLLRSLDMYHHMMSQLRDRSSPMQSNAESLRPLD